MGPAGVTSNVFYYRTLIANVVIISEAGHRGSTPAWVLVDAGMPGHVGAIVSAAARLFGAASRPSAIVLTHGHFDHVGSLGGLLAGWGDVPVYAHPLELPYLTGESDYPPPDPLVGGGLISLISRAFPRAAIHLGARVRPLPEDGSVPALEGWRWLHTPGHAPGHISLFRESDRTLVAGDAVITVKQESVVAVAMQRREVHGPPAYFTIDWTQAGASVARCADLEPAVLISGHGRPMYGGLMRERLRELAAEFDRQACPTFGRYVAAPARTDAHGVVSLPPDPLPNVLTGLLTTGAAVGAAAAFLRYRRAEAR